MVDTYDLIVVGAGWFGLAAAKTYIELHPEEKIAVIDEASSFGGTWSADRLYPGLKSNNLWGSYEYPDFPMSEEIYGVSEGQHIPAAVLHRYLTDFAQKFGIAERTWLNTKVASMEPSKFGGWILKISNSKGCNSVETKKVIIATGLTSQPNLPTYPGQETFAAPFFHAKDFAKFGDSVHTSKRTIVVGGGKSAYDTAYAFATEGDGQVDIIIRPTGQGPVWICPPYVTPFKRKLEELLNTRCLTWFAPCPWGDQDGYSVARTFLHKTGIGRFLVENYWNMMSAEVIETHGYNDDPELFKLKPWHPAFWTGSGVGIHNFATNFFDLVREGRIRVHIADISKLEGHTVYLTNKETIDTDLVVCATGWKKESSIKYVNIGEHGHGLPHTEIEKAQLRKDADKEILAQFPILKFQPTLRYERTTDEPLRNYRFIVPPTAVFNRNIAFAGMASTVSTAMFAAVQALWISAFLDGKLDRPPKNETDVTKEVMLHTQFGKWRYPCGYGDSLPDFAFDALPYVDLLVRDLGLKNHRKATPIAELTEPYKPWDFKGLTDEWVELHG